MATLAGISIDYCARLERGTETRPSPSVLDPADGADHFLAELSVIRAAHPVVLHLGPAEYRTLAARVPTLAEATTEPGPGEIRP